VLLALCRHQATYHDNRADFGAKNPDAKLEQLRRSSLIEIEHLKNDDHPNPPLRALPEHSVMTDEDPSISRAPLSEGASPHGLDGSSEQTDKPSSAPKVSNEPSGSDAPTPPTAPEQSSEVASKTETHTSPELSNEHPTSAATALPLGTERAVENNLQPDGQPSAPDISKEQSTPVPSPPHIAPENPAEADSQTDGHPFIAGAVSERFSFFASTPSKAPDGPSEVESHTDQQSPLGGVVSDQPVADIRATQ
jgi:pyruvate/2-oxoglutarate dehydrogenase complex dihydrolipoamide acyltransferase (E2) component